NIEMYGVVDTLASGPIVARASENSTMVGVGMCMEGIEHNPVVYELMPEMAFRKDKVNVKDWLNVYSHRRYGKTVKQAEAAWGILHQTIYNCSDGIADHNTDYIVKFPDWDPSSDTYSSFSRQSNKKSLITMHRNRRFVLSEVKSTLPQPHMWYSNSDSIKALKLLIEAGEDLAGSLTFRYDLVDLTRQVLSKFANQVYLDALIAFQHKDVVALKSHSQKFEQVIMDIDQLLAADDNFLLGTWLESAKKLALTPPEKRQYEWNARTQITMWYDVTKTNQSQLHDYANKMWSGLLVDYYLPRASMYFNRMSKSLTENTTFEIVEWRKEWISYSNKWQQDSKLYPVKAQGDALAISTSLFQKYFGVH
nr:alpha-N-acetylglucosaminidase [Tanacetum cinerariifolium]